MRFPPANIQLRRAQLSLILAVLVPTILMIVAGIILLATTKSSTTLALGVGHGSCLRWSNDGWAFLVARSTVANSN